MRIAAIGNCQVVNFASCLQVMAPRCRVATISLGHHALDLANDADVICVQTTYRHLLAPRGALAHLGDRRVVAWPTFNFPALHPDLVYVDAPNGFAQSPLGDYQSSLVFHAWSNGLDADETEALFCEPVYRHLGFLDYWDASARHMQEDMAGTGLDLHGAVEAWKARGCFAHSSNHPHLHVSATFAAAVLRRLGIAPRTIRPEDFLHDSTRDSAIWPVYPPVADRLGIPGDYTFKASRHLCPPEEPVRLFDLPQFIEASLACLDAYPRGTLRCTRLTAQAELYDGIRTVAPPPRRRRGNPYADLPAHRFWRKAVSRPDPADVDPVVRPRFTLSPADRVATAGSCFAQHIARTLADTGCNYHVTEPAPPGMPAEQAAANAYGLFSARYGNVYTARQLVQLIDRAYGRFHPADTAWPRPDGRFADPFRPQVEHDGFPTPGAVAAARDTHLAAVRTLFETADVLVFTLGLTEAWRATADGAVFPVVPGAIAPSLRTDDYEFVNFTAAEVRRDLRDAILKLRAVNPALRLILTVSPVPLVATFEDRHVLASTTYSKSVLRVAAEEIRAEFGGVDYFPSYEVITGGFNRGRYYADDLREVRPEGVAHVMRLFKAHFFPPQPALPAPAPEPASQAAPGGTPDRTPDATPDAPPGGTQPSSTPPAIMDALRREMSHTATILCDEELLEHA